MPCTDSLANSSADAGVMMQAVPNSATTRRSLGGCGAQVVASVWVFTAFVSEAVPKSAAVPH